jgi:hypothetical protein
LCGTIHFGFERTSEQDPKYPVRLLVDIAIKALSPAINDPTTAVQAIDQIEDLLRRLGGHADKAREDLIKSLMQPVTVTPEKIAEVKRRVFGQLRTAAGKGDKEVLVMRFPNALCTDKGRALNNLEKEWPSTLMGRPLQAFEFWRDHLQPEGYGLKAMIVDWPQGLPGDIGFFLTWGDAKR